MFSRLKFYLRFTLGMTRQEIRGISFLLGLLVLGMGVHTLYLYVQLKQDADLIIPKQFEEIYMAQKVAIRKLNFVRHSYPIYKGARSFPHYVKKSQDWEININEADSIAWVALPGIGPGFAKRIITFRERLGGFASADQLKEVYGIDTIWVKQHIRKFLVGKGVYRPLFVNRVIWNEFRHPYLPYVQAKVVLNFRKQHGAIGDFDALMQIKLIDPLVWERLKPYLNFAP
jgi:DNA uptake protein ComE-like DNA-binding protein